MPHYTWTGIQINGQRARGLTFAVSPQVLQSRLLERNIALLSCSISKRWYIMPISEAQKIELFEQLSILLASGVNLVAALDVVCQQLNDMRMAQTLDHMSSLVQEGHQLHTAMQYYGQLFSPDMVHMVDIGVRSGNLQLSLAALSTYMQARQEFKKKLRAALLVPAVTALFLIAIFVVMVCVMVPRYADLFISMGKPLPYITQLLFSLYQFLVSTYAFAVAAGLVLICLGGWYLAKQTQVRQWIDKTLLKIPVIGTLVQDIGYLQMFRSLSFLQEGGMSLVSALEIASLAVSNMVLRTKLAAALVEVRAGQSLSVALQDALIDYQEVILLITIGQEAGSLTPMIKKIAAWYDQRVTKKLAYYALLTQPICMLILGIMVAVLIVAVYMPLFDLANLT